MVSDRRIYYSTTAAATITAADEQKDSEQTERQQQQQQQRTTTCNVGIERLEDSKRVLSVMFRKRQRFLLSHKCHMYSLFKLAKAPFLAVKSEMCGQTDKAAI